MQFTLPFDQSDAEPIRVPDVKLVLQAVGPVSLSREELIPKLAAALENPIGYPPLSQSFVPGDRVVLAIDPQLPQAETIVGEIVRELMQAGVEPEHINVVTCAPLLTTDATNIVHNPDVREEHAYLAATREGRPIYLNRALGDADVVIPVVAVRLETSLDYAGIHGGWYPAFSNAETQTWFRSPGAMQWAAHRRRRREEVDQVAWQLGVRLVVEVLPAAGYDAANVWCGDFDAVSPHSQAACRRAWGAEVEQAADLIVAVLDAPASGQTWRNVARCLATAADVASSDGAIVLWTDVADDPGPVLMSLAQIDLDEHEQELRLLRENSADAIAAHTIAECLKNKRVYLRSRVNDATVEELGIAPLGSIAEVQRLVEQSAKIAYLTSAQHVGILSAVIAEKV